MCIQVPSGFELLELEPAGDGMVVMNGLDAGRNAHRVMLVQPEGPRVIVLDKDFRLKYTSIQTGQDKLYVFAK